MVKFQATALIALLVLCCLSLTEGQMESSFMGGRGGFGGGFGRGLGVCPWGYRSQGLCRREWDCGYRAFCHRERWGGYQRYGTCCSRRWGGRYDNWGSGSSW
ncbi:uncharacterized protein LOC111119754 [Crassostrea virginica]|uniref:Neuropeptide-like protein 33 n=1 Tax=Crassostrea virginica TaxID=6565 RepID=A0A8B8CJB3_CRAVI|nr:neuropeptide-like protein 33 [Crassostrea virginica]